MTSYPELGYAQSVTSAAADADVVVLTAWPEFAQVHPAEIACVARGNVAEDARQGISPAVWLEAGWQVFSLTAVID